MTSPLAQNAEVVRAQASRPPERPGSSDAKRRKRPSAIAEQRQERMAEKKEVVQPVTKFNKRARTAARFAPGFRRKRKSLKLAKRMSRKVRILPLAISYTVAFSFWWGVQAGLALLSAVSQYYVDETIVGAAANFIIPLSSIIWFINAAVVVIGVVAVQIGFWSILTTLTNPFRGPILILALTATFYYIACIGFPLLALFPILFLWLWLAAVFA